MFSGLLMSVVQFIHRKARPHLSVEWFCGVDNFMRKISLLVMCPLATVDESYLLWM